MSNIGSYEARLDGFRWDHAKEVLDWKDGELLNEQKLKSSPVYDSFAAANGKLYFTTADGRVACWE